MKRNWLEWLILGASVVLVVAIAGYLLMSGLGASRSAEIRAEVVMAEAAVGPSGGWTVPLLVRNDGGAAAVGVLVEGTATVDGSEETSELTVDLLAADSGVELVLGFSGEPDDAVEIRIVGFELP